MFSKLRKRLYPSTAFKLVLWSTLILGISLQLTDLITGPYMRARLLERDKKLILFKIQHYQDLYKNQNLNKLLDQLKYDHEENLLQGFITSVKEGQNTRLWLTAPYGWENVKPKNINIVRRTSDGFYFALDRSFVKEVIDEMDLDYFRDRKIAMIKEEILSENLFLQVGRAALFRRETEDTVKGQMKYVFAMILAFNALWGSIIFRFSLRSLRDLVQGMKTLKLGDIKARIPVRNKKSQLGTIAKLFNDSLDRIEVLINGMKEALDNVGHDLKTPMARIRLTIEKSVQSEDKNVLREALFDCAEEVNQIELMLKTLMDISEAEAGVLKLHREQFNLNLLVDECVKLYDYPAEMAQLSLTTDIPKHIDLLADRIRIKQAICNLIDNAIKYNSKAGTISVSANQLENRVQIIITDSGIGVHKSDLEKIFDRLYRVDKSRSQKGLGLGLSLVKAVISAHEGDIMVESEPHKGSKFILTI